LGCPPFYVHERMGGTPVEEFDIDTLIGDEGNTYALVVLAAKRARQIKDGSPPLVETNSRNPLTIALQEIAEGKVRIAPRDNQDKQGDTTDTAAEAEAATEQQPAQAEDEDAL